MGKLSAQAVTWRIWGRKTIYVCKCDKMSISFETRTKFPAPTPFHSNSLSRRELVLDCPGFPLGPVVPTWTSTWLFIGRSSRMRVTAGTERGHVLELWEQIQELVLVRACRRVRPVVRDAWKGLREHHQLGGGVVLGVQLEANCLRERMSPSSRDKPWKRLGSRRRDRACTHRTQSSGVFRKLHGVHHQFIAQLELAYGVLQLRHFGSGSYPVLVPKCPEDILVQHSKHMTCNRKLNARHMKKNKNT